MAVVDGLGHGPEATTAAQAAVDVLERHACQPLVLLLNLCHKALHGLRGAVMSLASFDATRDILSWTGVGNVAGILQHADPAARPHVELLVPRPGFLGVKLPTLATGIKDLAPGDTLILATDGIRSEFAQDLNPSGTPQSIADNLLAHHCKGNDDALVLVVRYLGRQDG